MWMSLSGLWIKTFANVGCQSCYILNSFNVDIYETAQNERDTFRLDQLNLWVLYKCFISAVVLFSSVNLNLNCFLGPPGVLEAGFREPHDEWFYFAVTIGCCLSWMTQSNSNFGSHKPLRSPDTVTNVEVIMDMTDSRYAVFLIEHILSTSLHKEQTMFSLCLTVLNQLRTPFRNIVLKLSPPILTLTLTHILCVV